MLKQRIFELVLVAFSAAYLTAMIFVFSSSEQPRQDTNKQSYQDRTYERSNDEQGESVRHWMTHDAAGFFTFWLVIVGGAQLVLFWVQLSLIRKSLTDAKIAADAAKDGAHAARDSADTAKVSMVASDRAYVYHSGCRWTSHHNPDQNRYFWRVRPMWINSGNTPTRELRVYVGYELRDTTLPDDYAFTQDPKAIIHPTAIAPKGIIGSATYDIFGDDLLAVSRGQKYFYVWGISRYRDVFPNSSDHITKFCTQATGVTGNLLIAFDDKANPLEIIFITFPRHNCADEDCQDNG